MTTPVAASSRLDYDHPVLGRMVEDLCAAHCADVLLALRTLGIGCIGESAESRGTVCGRCADPRERVLALMAEAHRRVVAAAVEVGSYGGAARTDSHAPSP